MRQLSRALSTAARRPNPHLHRADMCVTAVCTEADVRITAVRCSQLTLEAQRRWGWGLSAGSTDNVATTEEGKDEPATETRAWGAHAAYASMYASFLRGEERVKANLVLDMPASDASNESARVELYAEAICVGEVRGKATLSNSAPPESSNGEGGVGQGAARTDALLSVDRVLYGLEFPHSTTVSATLPSKSKPMSENAKNDFDDAVVDSARAAWQEFYDQSEQVPTFTVSVAGNYDGGGRGWGSTEADALDVLGESTALFVGGLTVQALPPSGGGSGVDSIEYADDSDVDGDGDNDGGGSGGGKLTRGAAAVAAIEKAWARGHLPSMAAVAAEGADGLEEYVRKIAAVPLNAGNTSGDSRSATPSSPSEISSLGAVSNLKKRPLDFSCRCSKEGFTSKLGMFARAQLESLKKEGGCELTCEFCNENYELTVADLDQVIAESKLVPNG